MIDMNDLEYVESLLSEADEYGLTAEIIVSAMEEVRKNPDISIKEAITSGFVEWIK